LIGMAPFFNLNPSYPVNCEVADFLFGVLPVIEYQMKTSDLLWVSTVAYLRAAAMFRGSGRTDSSGDEMALIRSAT